MAVSLEAAFHRHSKLRSHARLISSASILSSRNLAVIEFGASATEAAAPVVKAASEVGRLCIEQIGGRREFKHY
jgi:hypothetical protein